MKNIRYLLLDQFQAKDIAQDLMVQLEVNRIHDVYVTPIDIRNELSIQVPEANEYSEEVIGGFMKDYQKGVILE